MNINLNIEQLILDGIDLPRHQRPQLQAAIETELGRLLAADGLTPRLQAGGAVPHVPAGAIQLTGENNPTHLGHQIAQAVYGGLNR